ncbi:MAG: ABC transporter ATP-binding protein [bacterium]|jgi:simple sugar transport system ATP-binding protein|nr:ABC transporter ATP-binding protein [Chloroflexota bacterium]NBO51881.1 ABC transporter ATP-binding protein [Candidatus Aquidulcis sp.]
MRLELQKITKQFPGVLANDRISISVDRGQVLGLLGENGAGKTTLMNILSGLYRPDSGKIFIDGKERVFRDPAQAIEAGIGMVHQHFMLVPVFDVTESVVLGNEPTRGLLGSFDRATARKQVVELSERHGLQVDPDAKIESLPVGVRQRVEILKALYRKSDILVLDEPSAVLTPQETDELFEIIRGLAKRGTSIIFITHKLNEVIAVADKITVLRRGAVAGETTPKKATSAKLAEMMVGREVQLTVKRSKSKAAAPVLQVDRLRVLNDDGKLTVNNVSFDVRSGEILAVAGVQGNGQTELVEALTGLRQSDSGTIKLGGQDLTNTSPRVIASAGVAHIPEDRNRDGMVKGMTVAENYILNTYHLEPYSSKGVLNRNAIAQAAEQAVRDFDVRTPSIDTDIATLSGGNQQKVIVAREFSRNVKLVIAAQPTRGLDVGSIEYIHKRIVEQRDAGAAVLIVSTELDEVLALGDRVAVMYEGKVVGILDAKDATRERVGLLMGGIQK